MPINKKNKLNELVTSLAKFVFFIYWHINIRAINKKNKLNELVTSLAICFMHSPLNLNSSIKICSIFKSFSVMILISGIVLLSVGEEIEVAVSRNGRRNLFQKGGLCGCDMM